MEGYSVKIIKAPEGLTAKERIKVKDTSNAVSIDEVTQGEVDHLIIDYAYHVILAIHNEKSDSKDYQKVVVVDKAGNKFVTGSEAFLTAMQDIIDEMADAGEDDFQLEVYRKESKNYKGKSFITCSVA